MAKTLKPKDTLTSLRLSLRKAKSQIRSLIAAADLVSDNWCEGNLAAAVNELGCVAGEAQEFLAK